MQPFEADDHMHGMIVPREALRLECHHPVDEFEYYSNPKATTSWFDKELCAYYASSSGAKGVFEEDRTIEWKSVLPICCKDCCAYGAIPLARTKRRNRAANAKRTQRDRCIADASQANVDMICPLEATDIPPTTTSIIAPHATKCGCREDSERSGKCPRRRLPREIRG